jgi:hypothetical protein
LLRALPSYAIYRLDPFFQVHSPLRDPVVVTLLAIEVAVLCYVVYRIVRSMERDA